MVCIYLHIHTMNTVSQPLYAWVIHYTPLTERKQHILSLLQKHSVAHEFIEKHDKEHLTSQDLLPFRVSDKLRRGHISLFKKHLLAYEKIIASPHTYNLILEDDIIVHPHFNKLFQRSIGQLPNDYDMLFIGCGCGFRVPSEFREEEKGKYIYKKRNCEPTEELAQLWGARYATKCCDSYIVSPKCATRILDYVASLGDDGIELPIDLWLNDVCMHLDLKVYWMDPPVIEQGTEVGLFPSSLQNST